LAVLEDIEKVLEEEIFQTCSRRIGFYKQIKSEKIIRSKTKKSSKTSHKPLYLSGIRKKILHWK